MGKTTWTLKRIGCTTTCISMLSDYFGCYFDPGQMATSLLSYTVEGKLLWQSAKFSKFHFYRRFYNKDEKSIDLSLKSPNTAVILEVEGVHWVVALRKIGPLYWVADPWDGKKKLNLRKITGGAIFGR